MNRNPIFRWAALVFGFWWLFLYFFGNLVLPLVFDQWQPTLDTEAMAFHLRLWVTSVGVGAAAVIFGSLLIRRARQHRLEGRSVRGLRSMLGRVPLMRSWFSQDQLERKVEGRLADAEPADLDVWKHWRKENAERHPAHVALAEALLAIYEARADLPATHHDQGHGSRSLGAHCLSVAAEMVRRASAYRYSGLVNKRGKVVAPMQRADGVDLSSHPLVFITGLAHDLGKIEAYEFKDGQLVGCAREHDLLSARMLGRLEESWEIPHKDREALLVAVGHYHHPMSFPLDRQKRVSDDLGAALMLHLHDTDIAVSGMEDSDEYDKPEADDLTIYGAFVDVVSEVSRINGSEKQGSIGQKWKDLIILKESDLRRAMAETLGLQHLSPDESHEQITSKLLVELRERGLMATADDIQEVAFMRGETAISAPWRDAIVIRPAKILPGLTGMPDYDSTATAVLKGNPKKNTFVDDEIEQLRRQHGGEGAKASPATSARVDDDDDEFMIDPFGGVVGAAAAAEPQVTPQAAAHARATPPEKSRMEAAARPAAALAPATAAPSPTMTPVLVEAPAAAPEAATLPEKQAPAPASKAAPATEGGAPREGKPTFAMKNLSHLIEAASAARAGGKGSRLEAFYNELIRAAPPPQETAGEVTANETAGEPEPVAAAPVTAADSAPKPQPTRGVPQRLAEAIASSEFPVRPRPSGNLVVIVPDPVADPVLSKWIKGLPESPTPDPASVVVVEGRRLVLLHKDWERHVA